MSIFELHATVLRDYQEYVRSFFAIADERARTFVDQALTDEGRLWPDFLLQLSPSYRRNATVDELAREGIIHSLTAEIFRNASGQPFRLYEHQRRALDQAARRFSYVVTSGTGSGKSLTYFLPIVDALCRSGETSDGVAALVIYPMNALVNSQLKSLQALRKNFERRTGRQFPVTFARYTGETAEVERGQIQRQPPQIILTNYVMAELMLVRPEDDRLLDRSRRTLRFLVLDELHTYRGRQGADVALLIRRVRERCAGADLLCIGTSATMVSDRNASPAVRKEAVAEFAHLFFGQPLTGDNVVEEFIEPLTSGTEPPSDTELAASLSSPLPTELQAFRQHALARWGSKRRRRAACAGGCRELLPAPQPSSLRTRESMKPSAAQHCARRSCAEVRLAYPVRVARLR